MYNNNTASCAIWLRNMVTLKDERRLRAFENKILRRKFVPQRDENVDGEGFKMKNLIVCTVRRIKVRRLKD